MVEAAFREGVPRRRFLKLGSCAVAGTAAAVNSTADEVEEELLNKRIDSAVLRALQWLAAEQQPSGAWTTNDFGESTATTALAMMAFMAAGHVPNEGPWGKLLPRGLAWLTRQQRDNGLLVGARAGHGPMYSHGIATLMLAEISGMLGGRQEEECRLCLERAIRLIIDAQNHPRPEEHRGGWRYQPTSRDSDLSVSAWQLLALRAARDIGCDVPVENIDRAIAYLKRLHVRHDGGFGYMVGHGSTITRAGTGITALEICGEHRTPETMAAARMILSRPLVRSEHYFFYGAYYCTVGMYKVGGEEWQQARRHLYETILELQGPPGYWTPEDGTERQAGRVYSTSLAVLALSIEYGFLPVYQR